jgi:hypothetical protein
MFSLNFDTDNAAFGDDDEDDRRAECARILRVVADALEAGRYKGRCIDLNGNSVGDWGFE